MAEQKLWQRWKSLSRLQRWSIITACSLLLYTVFGFLILPAIVRSQLEKKLTLALHRQTTVQQVKFNPYTLQVAVNGFTIQDPEGKEPFVSFDSLQVNLQWVSLFKRAIIAKSFALVNPYTKIVMNKDKSFNFSDLAGGNKEAAKEEPQKEEKAEPLQFSINNIDLSGGKVDFEDKVKDVSHHITDLHIALPFISDLPYEIEIFTKPAFEAVINGTPVSMLGESKPFHRTRQSEISVNFADIDITDYLAYLPDNLNFTIQNGRLDLALSLSFMQHEDGNPAVNIRGKAGLREIKVVDQKQQPLLLFPELSVEIDRAHVLRKEFHLAKILWKEPELFVQRQEDGQINLANLVAPSSGGETKPTAPAPASRPLLLEVVDMELAAATIHFTDRTVSGPMQTTLQPVNLQVKDFSTVPDKTAGYQLALTSESNEQIRVDGTFSLDPLKVTADAGLENVQLGKYRPYYENALRAQLAAEKVKIGAHMDYVAADSAMLISGLGIELGGLTVIGPDGADKVLVPDFSVSEAEVNLKDKTVVVGRCASHGAVIPLARRQDGSINLQDFLAAAPPAKETPAEEEQETTEDQAAPPPAWQVLVKAVDFAEYEVSFTDQVPEEQVVLTMNQMHLTAENVTTSPDKEFSVGLDLLFNKSGKVKVQGSATLSPLALRLDLDLADLPLKSVQPYVEQKLNIIMADGLGAVNGKVTMDRPENGEMAITFLGEVGSRRFVCLDAKKAEKLLTWDDIRVKKLNVQTKPMAIKAEEVSLNGLSAFVSKNQEGVVNLSTIVRKPEGQQEKEEAAQAEGPQTDVEIKLVRLANCQVAFTDRSVAPHYKTTLQKIDGDIKGLSSSKDVSADVNITAKLDQHSPVKIAGSIHPWQEFYTDVTAEFSDIELSPTSPYTIKFIGFPLTKGKLSLNLHYLIDGKKLTSVNKAYIDQITLGKYVKNETAVNLPVQLAISLLKNRRGEIDLNIPVAGQLDDPEFSVAGVVFKILTNLIVKAATSPFSLLGAIFEGGGEAQYVQFTAADTQISPEEMEVLSKFAKVLYDRPAIKVELTGQFDAAEDSRIMTQIRFDRLLKVQKMKDMAKKEAALTDVDAVEITADEYERYLEKAYKDAEFERPRNFLGLLKDVPAEEMEQMLYDNIVITDDDLRNLVVERASAVRDVLIEKGPVEPERIFLIAPQGAAGGQQGTRVEIALK